MVSKRTAHPCNNLNSFQLRKFPNGNELQFHYSNGEPDGPAILIHETSKEEFTFVAGQKQVRWPSLMPSCMVDQIQRTEKIGNQRTEKINKNDQKSEKAKKT